MERLRALSLENAALMESNHNGFALCEQSMKTEKNWNRVVVVPFKPVNKHETPLNQTEERAMENRMKVRTDGNTLEVSAPSNRYGADMVVEFHNLLKRMNIDFTFEQEPSAKLKTAGMFTFDSLTDTDKAETIAAHMNRFARCSQRA